MKIKFLKFNKVNKNTKFLFGSLLISLLVIFPFFSRALLTMEDFNLPMPKVLGVSTYSTVTLYKSSSLTLRAAPYDFDSSSGKWNYKISWVRRASLNGSILINGNMFISSTKGHTEQYTGYSLTPGAKYKIVFRSSANGKGGIVASKILTVLASPSGETIQNSVPQFQASPNTSAITTPVSSGQSSVPAITANPTASSTLATSTYAVAITVSSGASASTSQSVLMGQHAQVLATINIQETLGNEPALLKGLMITALANGGSSAGGGAPNTGYSTFKNFVLTDGTNSVIRTGWGGRWFSPQAGGYAQQNYTLDFFTGSPLNFVVPQSGVLTLSLLADVNDWSNGAAANSSWQFYVYYRDDVAVYGQYSNTQVLPLVDLSAPLMTTVVTKPTLSFNPANSITSPSYFALGQNGNATTQDTVGIFQFNNPTPSKFYLTSVTLTPSGTASSTSTPTTYYVFNSNDLAHPVGSVSIAPGASGTVYLNFGLAVLNGMAIYGNSSGYLVIKADTTSFNTCGVGCNTPYTYGLSLAGWQWTDADVPGVANTGPVSPDTAKVAIYGNNLTTRSY